MPEAVYWRPRGHVVAPRFQTRPELVNAVGRAGIRVDLAARRLEVTDAELARRDGAVIFYSNAVDYGRVRSAHPDVMTLATWGSLELGSQLGVYPASFDAYYQAVGRGEVSAPPTIPAVNHRVAGLEMQRSMASVLGKMRGRAINEIARSETTYDVVSHREHAVAVVLGRVMENVPGPVALQADHTQLAAAKYYAGYADRMKEVKTVYDFIRAALTWHHWNIDIDPSVLEILDYRGDRVAPYSVVETAFGIQFLRGMQREMNLPSILVGVESGEVGASNTSLADLMGLFGPLVPALKALGLDPGKDGPRKISVQSGASHGGIILADGSRAEVKLDPGVLSLASEFCRNVCPQLGLGAMAGSVQHGASTLKPDQLYIVHTRGRAAEVHLATAYQDHILGGLPADLMEGRVWPWVETNFAGKDKEWPIDKATGQPVSRQKGRKAVKYAGGPFKLEIDEAYAADPDAAERTFGDLCALFSLHFRQLGVEGSADKVDRYVSDQVRTEPYLFPDEGTGHDALFVSAKYRDLAPWLDKAASGSDEGAVGTD